MAVDQAKIARLEEEFKEAKWVSSKEVWRCLLWNALAGNGVGRDLLDGGGEPHVASLPDRRSARRLTRRLASRLASRPSPRGTPSDTPSDIF